MALVGTKFLLLDTRQIFVVSALNNDGVVGRGQLGGELLRIGIFFALLLSLSFHRTRRCPPPTAHQSVYSIHRTRHGLRSAESRRQYCSGCG